MAPYSSTPKAARSRRSAALTMTSSSSPSEARTTISARPASRIMRSSSNRRSDARRFHERMVNACIRAHAQSSPLGAHQLKVAIIGAGATGVELAAELHRTTREVVAYGLDQVDPQKDIRITLIEAAERVLPALPERVSKETEKLLRQAWGQSAGRRQGLRGRLPTM